MAKVLKRGESTSVEKIYLFEPPYRCNFMFFGNSGSGKSSVINTFGSHEDGIGDLVVVRGEEVGQCTKVYTEIEAAENVRFFDTWGVIGGNYSVKMFELFLQGYVPKDQQMNSRLSTRSREGNFIIDNLLLVVDATAMGSGKKLAMSLLKSYQPYIAVCQRLQVNVFVIVTKIDMWWRKSNLKISPDKKKAVKEVYRSREWEDLRASILEGLNCGELDVYPIINYSYIDQAPNLIVEEFSKVLVTKMTQKLYHLQELEDRGEEELDEIFGYDGLPHHMIRAKRPKAIGILIPGSAPPLDSQKFKYGNTKRTMEIIGQKKGYNKFYFKEPLSRVLRIGNDRFRISAIRGWFQRDGEMWIQLMNPDHGTFECVVYDEPGLLGILRRGFGNKSAPKYQFLDETYSNPHDTFNFQKSCFIRFVFACGECQLILARLQKKWPIHGTLENFLISTVQKRKLHVSFGRKIEEVEQSSLHSLRKIENEMMDLKSRLKHYMSPPQQQQKQQISFGYDSKPHTPKKEIDRNNSVGFADQNLPTSATKASPPLITLGGQVGRPGGVASEWAKRTEKQMGYERKEELEEEEEVEMGGEGGQGGQGYVGGGGGNMGMGIGFGNEMSNVMLGGMGMGMGLGRMDEMKKRGNKQSNSFVSFSPSVDLPKQNMNMNQKLPMNQNNHGGFEDFNKRNEMAVESVMQSNQNSVGAFGGNSNNNQTNNNLGGGMIGFSNQQNFQPQQDFQMQQQQFGAFGFSDNSNTNTNNFNIGFSGGGQIGFSDKKDKKN